MESQYDKLLDELEPDLAGAEARKKLSMAAAGDIRNKNNNSNMNK